MGANRLSLENLKAARAAAAAVVARLDDLIAEGVAAPAPADSPLSSTVPPLAWGAKVSAAFRDRVRWIAEDLDIGPAQGQPAPDWLMTWMAWESGRSFRPDVKNMAGSGATGLIQFMPTTAVSLGTTVEKLAAMTAEDQLNFVWKYFAPYKGRIRSLADGYMAILWPAAVGHPPDYVLWSQAARPTTFRQNAGLDVNKDGVITKAEAAAKVSALLPEGLSKGNAA
jgi:hypothetical protein